MLSSVAQGIRKSGQGIQSFFFRAGSPLQNNSDPRRLVDSFSSENLDLTMAVCSKNVRENNDCFSPVKNYGAFLRLLWSGLIIKDLHGNEHRFEPSGGTIVNHKVIEVGSEIALAAGHYDCAQTEHLVHFLAWYESIKDLGKGSSHIAVCYAKNLERKGVEPSVIQSVTESLLWCILDLLIFEDVSQENIIKIFSYFHSEGDTGRGFAVLQNCFNGQADDCVPIFSSEQPLPELIIEYDQKKRVVVRGKVQEQVSIRNEVTGALSPRPVARVESEVFYTEATPKKSFVAVDIEGGDLISSASPAALVQTAGSNVEVNAESPGLNSSQITIEATPDGKRNLNQELEEAASTASLRH